MPRRWSDLLPELRPVDAVVVGLLLVMVVLTALTLGTWVPGTSTAGVLAVIATGTVQTVPVLWRRERPVGALLVFGVMVPIGWMVSGTVATWAWAVLVYGVVRRARPVPGALATIGTSVLAPLLAGFAVYPGDPETAVGLAVGMDVTLVPVVLAVSALAVVTRARAAQAAVRRRREEHDRLADALAAQRDRLAGDLRELVAVRVERVVTRTRALTPVDDPGPTLSAIAAEARAALAGMRRALSVLRAAPPAADTEVAAPPRPDAPSWRPSRGGLLLGAVALAVTAGIGLLANVAIPHLEPGPATDAMAMLDLDVGRPFALTPLVVQALALGWWRRAPLPALVVATAASCVGSVLGTTHIVTEATWGVLVFGAGLAAGTVASAVTVTVCSAAVLVTTLVVGWPGAVPVGRAGIALSYLLVPAVWGLGVLQRRSAQADARRSAERAAAAASRAVTAQRLGLARELHDVLAHELSALVVTVHAARVAPEPATLDAITEAGERIAGALPTLLEGLGPGVPSGDAAEHLELDTAAVTALVAPVRDAGLPVTVDVVGDASADRPETDVIAARIVTEALTNALRHAGPAPTRVTVRHEPDVVAVEVVDEGVRAGHRQAGEGSGLGIVGMRERAALVGGTVEAGPCGAGWRVAAHLPRREAGLLLEEDADGPGPAPRRTITAPAAP
ncbi:histidine kinase [Actinomycetospora succinea]|uniref:histidine kinase n=1 Tax=Actinomycetospora succinea TaxID=663603 RepID=A0A4R6VSX1_9PSEU|nr:ATP-binding protein [Actinomycetospora succinea]TDQ65727.1 histidine kinase [Actinomycetospora succinea]